METASQFILFRDLLKKKLGKKYTANILATTDASGGTLREICKEEKYRTLEVPDGVGGRFSVLSAVGLFSAAMTGIKIDKLRPQVLPTWTRCCKFGCPTEPSSAHRCGSLPLSSISAAGKDGSDDAVFIQPVLPRRLVPSVVG